MINRTCWYRFFSVCWAQLQEQRPAEERTTTLTPVLRYSSAFSAVRCDVRSKSADCLFQWQFQPALACHYYFLFLTHPVELMSMLAHACARIMHVCTHAHAVHPRFAFLFWQVFKSFNYIHRHSTAWQPPSEGWHMLILQFNRSQALFCSYLPSSSCQRIWMFPEIMYTVWFLCGWKRWLE